MQRPTRHPKRIPTDRKLDVALAALRGAGLTPREIALSAIDRDQMNILSIYLAATTPDLPAYRGVSVRVEPVKSSYVLVDTHRRKGVRAPLAPRRFARWFPMLEHPDPQSGEQEASQRVA